MTRHDPLIAFAPLGPEGRRRLAAGRVLLVGAGGTGSALAEGLVRAGVGSLVLFDDDHVEEGNLGRQSLYSETDLGRPKATAAHERLTAINRQVDLTTIEERVVPGTLDPWLEGCDLILDGSDNFATRLLLNDVSQRAGIPWIHTAAHGSLAVSMPVLPGETACLRCLYPETPVDEKCGGILQPTVAAAAALSGVEALKILSGRRDEVRRELWTLDLWDGRLGRVRTAKPRPGCAACGGNPGRSGYVSDESRR